MGKRSPKKIVRVLFLYGGKEEKIVNDGLFEKKFDLTDVLDEN